MRQLLVRSAAASALGVLLLAGCQGMEPAPCTSDDRAAHAALIQPMDTAARRFVRRRFEQQDRIQRLDLAQADCHIRATLTVDSLATEAYAIAQVEALVRELKKSAPGETKPLPEQPGEGLYDYVVTVRRTSADAQGGASEEQRPMLKGAKLYSESRVLWQ